jgi:ElaB/YqjD/DUF883 family membrane-anchored ribosome-binding protein
MSAQNISRSGHSEGLADEIPMAAANLAGKIERAGDRAGDLYQRVKARAVEKEEEFEGYVKEHPVKSVLVAGGIGAGVGLVLGVLLARR